MIRAEELRIGNWLECSKEDGYMEVHNIMDEGINFSGDTHHVHSFYPYENLKGIPLSPEVLIACGFELETKVWWKFPEEDISGWVLLDNSPVDESFSLCFDQLVLGIPLTKYLHQLQNLYFSLTQTELNYEELADKT